MGTEGKKMNVHGFSQVNGLGDGCNNEVGVVVRVCVVKRWQGRSV